MVLRLAIDETKSALRSGEASRAIRQAEVGAAKTMIERTQERFDLKPEYLAADTAYGSAAMLNWVVNEQDKTLAGVANFLSDPRRPIEATLRAMMDRPHPVVASAARELLNKSENERSGVLSTAMSFLGLYREPPADLVENESDQRLGAADVGRRHDHR